jgi:hypothetical protein
MIFLMDTIFEIRVAQFIYMKNMSQKSKTLFLTVNFTFFVDHSMEGLERMDNPNPQNIIFM